MTEHHAHEWEPSDSGFTCAECDETSAACVVTDTRRGEHATGSSLLICDRCIDHERRVLDDIASALGHYQVQPRSDIPAIRYDRDRSDGGGEYDPAAINEPGDIVEILWSWAAMWSEGLGIELLPTATESIKGAMLWAAHHEEDSAFSAYRGEMRKLRHHARRLSGLLPKRHYGPCVHCGGRVVQDWADDRWRPLADGLSDVVRCTGCGITWGDRQRWDFTNRHTLRLLPEYFPEHLVTIEEAWLIFPEVPKATWRKWRQRDDERHKTGEWLRMPIRSWDERGRPLYRVGDLADTAQFAGVLKPIA